MALLEVNNLDVRFAMRGGEVRPARRQFHPGTR